VIFKFFLLLQADDRADRPNKISSMDYMFLLLDTTNFKIFQTSNFLAF
jgi:hypothetical protein